MSWKVCVFGLGGEKGPCLQGFEPQTKQTLKLGVMCRAQNQQEKAWKPALAEPLAVSDKPSNHPALPSVSVK